MSELRKLDFNPFVKFDEEWAIVTAGNRDGFNGMTISWGSAGILWNKEIINVYIKPCRYTESFTKENDYFTVSFFPKECREALNVMGTKSGRDCDKVKEANLTPVFLKNGVDYKEASLTIVCRKIYAAPFVSELVPEFAHERYYTKEEEHVMYIGEVVEVIQK